MCATPFATCFLSFCPVIATARVRRVRSHCGVRIAEPPRFCRALARHLHVRHHVSCYIPAAAAPSRPCSSASGVCAGRDLGSACIVSHLLLSIPDTKQRRLSLAPIVRNRGSSDKSLGTWDIGDMPIMIHGAKSASSERCFAAHI